MCRACVNAAGDFVPRLRLRRGELDSVLAMEVLGVVLWCGGARRRLAPQHVQELLLGFGSICSHRRQSLGMLETPQAGASSGAAAPLHTCSGVLVLLDRR